MSASPVVEGNFTRRVRFGDVVSAMLSRKDLSKRALAEALDVSPATITLIGKGERPLSVKIEQKLADVLGGDPEVWQSIYQETKLSTDKPLNYFKSLLLDSTSVLNLSGTRVRRCRKEHILTLQNDKTEYDRFHISDFEENRLQETSYDATIGSITHSGSRLEGLSEYEIPPQACVLVRTLEAFTIPKWMEADVHAPTSLALKHLIVSGGPIIDPGWDKLLTVSIFNPTGETVTLLAGDPILTVRFWLHDV